MLTSGLLITAVPNTKIIEVEKKIPDTSSLVSITVFNTTINFVENKNPDYVKCITTEELNKKSFDTRLK